MGHLHKGNNMYISIGTEIKTFKNLISLRIKYITIIEIYNKSMYNIFWIISIITKNSKLFSISKFLIEKKVYLITKLN